MSPAPAQQSPCSATAHGLVGLRGRGRRTRATLLEMRRAEERAHLLHPSTWVRKRRSTWCAPSTSLSAFVAKRPSCTAAVRRLLMHRRGERQHRGDCAAGRPARPPSGECAAGAPPSTCSPACAISRLRNSRPRGALTSGSRKGAGLRGRWRWNVTSLPSRRRAPGDAHHPVRVWHRPRDTIGPGATSALPTDAFRASPAQGSSRAA